jgi:hypothetical protein
MTENMGPSTIQQTFYSQNYYPPMSMHGMHQAEVGGFP